MRLQPLCGRGAPAPQTSFHLSRTRVRPCKTLTDQRSLLDANAQRLFNVSVYKFHARLISNRPVAIHALPDDMILCIYTLYGIFVNPSKSIFSAALPALFYT